MLLLTAVWARLGADVTVVEYLDRIVPTMVGTQAMRLYVSLVSVLRFVDRDRSMLPLCVQDGEVRRAFQRSLQKQGMKFKLSTKVGGQVEQTFVLV